MPSVHMHLVMGSLLHDAVQYRVRRVSHGTLTKQSNDALAEEVWLKVIDCVWLHYALSASTPPQTSSSRGSKATWTCSLPWGVWVTCAQEGTVIHHHPLDQTGSLTTGDKSTTRLPGQVSACSALLTPDCPSVNTFKTSGGNIQYMWCAAQNN